MELRGVGDLRCTNLPVAASIRNINERYRTLNWKDGCGKEGQKLKVESRSRGREADVQPSNFLEAEESASCALSGRRNSAAPDRPDLFPSRFHSNTRHATLSSRQQNS